MRRDHVASTLIRRHFNVVCPLGLWLEVRVFAIGAYLIGQSETEEKNGKTESGEILENYGVGLEYGQTKACDKEHPLLCRTT